MKIIIDNISKRFKKEWIVKNISLEISPADKVVILGANGSGKSTLIKLIAGALHPTEGNISYTTESIKLSSLSDEIYNYISIAAPYMELIEDYTLIELIDFHSRFKKFTNNIELNKIPELFNLKNAENKQLKYYSSGMRQRVRLGLAILSNCPILLLDEPCSNLDNIGIEWYNRMITNYALNRTVIVCSNHIKHEYGFCSKELTLGS